MNFDKKTKIIKESLMAVNNPIYLIEKSKSTYSVNTEVIDLLPVPDGGCPECKEGKLLRDPVVDLYSCHHCGYTPELLLPEERTILTKVDIENKEKNIRDLEEDVKTNL